MKKIFLILAITTAQFVLAQSPNILKFREILKEAPTEFSKFQKDVTQDLPELRTIVYSTTNTDSSFLKNMILKTVSLPTTYNIYIDASNFDEKTMKVFNATSNEYLTEFKAMLKSGKYKGDDTTDGGRRTIELKNLQGHRIAQYANYGFNFEISIYASPSTIVNGATTSSAIAEKNTFTFVNSSETNTAKPVDAAKKLRCIKPDGRNTGEVQHKNREVVYIIKNRGEWTSVKLNQEPAAIDAMLKSGLYTEKDFNFISNLATEKTYAQAISTYMLRQKNRDMAQNYTCVKIAEFTTSYAPYSVLWIPKEDNLNLPTQMQPSNDNGFYIVIQTTSIATEQQPSSQNQVLGLENGVPITGTTASGIQYTIMNEAMSTTLGSMAIYVGETMYVVLIKGKKLENEAHVSAKAAAQLGVSDFKYQWFPASNCETLKYKYGSVLKIMCGYELSLD